MVQSMSTRIPRATHGEVPSPRTGYSDGPELYNPPPPQHEIQKQYIQGSELPPVTHAAPIIKEKRILGLRRPTFWLLIVLLVVVVVAAVGGGVGGALAVQNAK